MAQEHVAGLGLDDAQFSPVVVDDLVSILQASPKLPPDCVGCGCLVPVGKDQVYALGSIGRRSGWISGSGHATDSPAGN